MSAKHWVFTWNNPSITPDQLITLFKEFNIKYAFQLEAGQEATEHYQGYVQLERRQRMSYLQRKITNRAHWEIARGNPQQCIAYCTKNDTRIDGPWLHDDLDRTGEGRRSDLQRAVAVVLERGLRTMVEQYPVVFVKYHRGLRELVQFHRRQRILTEPPEVIWVYGTPGSGKSTIAHAIAPGSYHKNNTGWWDGYDDHSTVIWDEFSGQVPFRNLLTWLDKFPARVDYKGGTFELLVDKWIFTSNNPPWNFYGGLFQTEHTIEALLRRITLFVHRKDFVNTVFFENSNDAITNYN